MELTEATVVRLPAQLAPDSIAPLVHAVRAAFDSPSRLALFVGADDHTFCTGLALDGDHAGDVDTQAFAELLAELADAPKPTLAFVDGRAIGGGLGLMAACDWVVASERASFALPELLWGIIPAMIWPIVTMRLTEGTARRWTISAHARSAAEACAAGLVDDVAPAGREQDAVRRAARMLRRAEPNALRCLRRWARDARGPSLESVLTRGASLTAGMAAQPVARARVEAFRRGETPWD